MLRLMNRAIHDKATQGALCADDYWMYFRACKTPRDEIIEGIRYDQRRYREVTETKEDDWVFVSNAFRADYLDAYDYLLRFDVKDIAERIEWLEDRYCLILQANLDAGGNGHDFTPVQYMLMGIYQQRIQSLLHQLKITFYRWRKFHQTSPQETVVEMRKALVGETTYANPWVDNQITRFLYLDKEIPHVTPL